MIDRLNQVQAILDDHSLQSEEKAAKILELFESFSSKIKRKSRESFDGEQLKKVLRAMSDHQWHTLEWICAEAGYGPSSIPAINARIRELPNLGYKYERRKIGKTRMHEYRLIKLGEYLFMYSGVKDSDVV